jgi:hypothetical protein
MRDLPPILGELDRLQPEPAKETKMLQNGHPSLPAVSKTQSHFCEPPSPSIDERALGQFDANDHLFGAAFEALKACRVAAQGTHAACVATHANTVLSEGQRHLSAAEVANTVISRPLPLVDAAGGKLAAEITRLEAKIRAPAAGTGIREVQLSTEIRIYLRDLPDTDRRRVITKSLASGDDQILSAIMSAPACLSGLSDVEVSSFALTWRQKRFPSELARIAVLEKASKALYLGAQLLVGYGPKMASPHIVRTAKAFQATTAAAIKAATGAQ